MNGRGERGERSSDRVVDDTGLHGLVSIGDLLARRVSEQEDTIKFLNDSIEVVSSLGDHCSFELMLEILTSEEEHADWLEAQHELIAQVGLQNYLSQQIKYDEDCPSSCFAVQPGSATNEAASNRAAARRV